MGNHPSQSALRLISDLALLPTRPRLEHAVLLENMSRQFFVFMAEYLIFVAGYSRLSKESLTVFRYDLHFGIHQRSANYGRCLGGFLPICLLLFWAGLAKARIDVLEAEVLQV